MEQILPLIEKYGPWVLGWVGCFIIWRAHQDLQKRLWTVHDQYRELIESNMAVLKALEEKLETRLEVKREVDRLFNHQQE